MPREISFNNISTYVQLLNKISYLHHVSVIILSMCALWVNFTKVNVPKFIVVFRRQMEFREVFFKRYAMITGFWKLIEYILSKSWKNLGTLSMKIETLTIF